MKKLLLLFLGFFVLTGSVLSEEVRSELSTTMAQIQSSVDALKRDVQNNEARESNLVHVDQLIAAAERALRLEPPVSKPKELTAEEREKFLARYQAAMQAVLNDAKVLRRMIVEGTSPSARQEQLMKVYRHQESGHESFQEK